MLRQKYQRLLLIASRLERVADTRISFDDFVSDLTETHDDLAEAINSAEVVRDTLTRSGYGELANRISKVIKRIQSVSDVMDTLRKMHSQGKLRYGPRVPPSVWERRTVREESPLVNQEKPRLDRPTRDLYED